MNNCSAKSSYARYERLRAMLEHREQNKIGAENVAPILVGDKSRSRE